jgi:hypothetical protein
VRVRFVPTVGDLIDNEFSNVACIHLQQSVTWLGTYKTALLEVANDKVHAAGA